MDSDILNRVVRLEQAHREFDYWKRGNGTPGAAERLRVLEEAQAEQEEQLRLQSETLKRVEHSVVSLVTEWRVGVRVLAFLAPVMIGVTGWVISMLWGLSR